MSQYRLIHETQNKATNEYAKRAALVMSGNIAGVFAVRTHSIWTQYMKTNEH